MCQACDYDVNCLDGELQWILENVSDTLKPIVYSAFGWELVGNDQPDAGLALLRSGFTTIREEQHDIRLHYLTQFAYYHGRITQNMDSSFYYLYAAIKVGEPHNKYDLWKVHLQLADNFLTLDDLDKAATQLEKALFYARQRKENRNHYGLILFMILQTALERNAPKDFDQYLDEYVNFLAQARTINPTHDAVLQHLISGEDGIDRLEQMLDNNRAPDSPGFGSRGYDYVLLANALFRQQRYTAAEGHLRTALDYFRRIDNRIFLRDAYDLLRQLGQASGNATLELEGLRAYSQLRDSLNLAAFNESISEWEIKYETEQKEAQLAQQELALLRAQKQRNGLLLGGALLASLAMGVLLVLRARLRYQRSKAEQEQLKKEQEIANLRKENQLNRLRALIEGQEGERLRVAKDLHDGLGGLLATVRSHVGELAVQQTGEHEVAINLLERASKDVRRIAHNMVPSQLAEGGLSSALEDLQGQLRIQGLQCALEVIGEPDQRLDETKSNMLLRITQELTHNVSKHAEADHVFIQLLCLDDQLLLTVEDDGKGFEQAENGKNKGGLGMQSIEDRATYLNGKLTFDSVLGKGTTVNLSVPLEKGNFAAN